MDYNTIASKEIAYEELPDKYKKYIDKAKMAELAKGYSGEYTVVKVLSKYDYDNSFKYIYFAIMELRSYLFIPEDVRHLTDKSNEVVYRKIIKSIKNTFCIVGGGSNLMDIINMCTECEATHIDVSELNTENVVNMHSAFDLTKAEDINLEGFRTGKCEDMGQMFFDSRNLEKINLSSFDTTSCKNYYLFVAGCPSLKYLDISNFKNIDEANTMHMLEAYGRRIDIHVKTRSQRIIEWFITNRNHEDIEEYLDTDVEEFDKYSCKNGRIALNVEEKAFMLYDYRNDNKYVINEFYEGITLEEYPCIGNELTLFWEKEDIKSSNEFGTEKEYRSYYNKRTLEIRERMLYDSTRFEKVQRGEIGKAKESAYWENLFYEMIKAIDFYKMNPLDNYKITTRNLYKHMIRVNK